MEDTEREGRFDAIPEKERAAFARLDEMAEESAVVGGMMTQIAGVYCGVKPAAILEMGYVTEEMRDDWQEHGWEEMGGVAEDLGMVMIESGEDRVLSRDWDVAEELKEALAKLRGGDSGEETRELEMKVGKLLGFPETSTAAFLGEAEKLPDEMKYIKAGTFEGHDVYEFKIHDMRYAEIALSKEHFLEEVEAYGVPIRQAVEELMPKFYAKEDFKTILV